MTHESVSEYYSKVLSKTSDLKTSACCTSEAPPLFLRSALSKIHDSVLAKYYGCGLILPELLSNLRILDLGCGSGRDCYVLSQLVGENGSVVGVDMTEEQLDVAESSIDFHRQAFKYKKANTIFLTGYIERLDEIEGLEPESFDIIVSNCVINLSPDKAAVLKQAYTLLKPGGEVYFSDVYSSKRVPQSLREDPILWGECLSGALYWNDFENLARACGFTDPRLVSDAVITANNKNIESMLVTPAAFLTLSDDLLRLPGSIKFFSATYRLFKIPELEPHCEDYGQAVRYKGTMPDHYIAPSAKKSVSSSDSNGGGSSACCGGFSGSIPAPATAAATDATAVGANILETFNLDAHHSFVAGKIYPVCGNTYRMLHQTRFAPHFDFFGSFDVHYGIFAGCGKDIPFASARTGSGNSGSCNSGGCC